jgi:hypothetical protein
MPRDALPRSSLFCLGLRSQAHNSKARWRLVTLYSCDAHHRHDFVTRREEMSGMQIVKATAHGFIRSLMLTISASASRAKRGKCPRKLAAE